MSFNQTVSLQQVLTLSRCRLCHLRSSRDYRCQHTDRYRCRTQYVHLVLPSWCYSCRHQNWEANYHFVHLAFPALGTRGPLRDRVRSSVSLQVIFTRLTLPFHSGVYANSDSTNTGAGIATVVLVWIYLGVFNLACPILYSCKRLLPLNPQDVSHVTSHLDPAEIQTFAMRTKGLLVWNTFSQCMGAYVTWVDAIALDKIGMSSTPTFSLSFNPLMKTILFRLQVLRCLHAVGRDPVGAVLQM